MLRPILPILLSTACSLGEPDLENSGLANNQATSNQATSAEEVTSAPVDTKQSPLPYWGGVAAVAVAAGAFAATRFLRPSKKPIDTELIPNAQNKWQVEGGDQITHAITDTGGSNQKLSIITDGEQNEDGAYLFRKGPLTLVAAIDGAGGSGRGTLFTKTVAKKLKEFAQTLPQNQERFMTMLGELHQELCALSHNDRDKCYGTLAIAQISRNNATLFAIGDAMAIVVGKSGEIKAITDLQNRAANAIREGSATKASYYTNASSNDSHIITNTIGVEGWYETERVSVIQVDLEPGDRVITMSDGIIDKISPEEIAKLAQEGNHAEEVAKSLIKKGLERNNIGRHTILIDGKEESFTNRPFAGDNLTVAVHVMQ